jgi:low affinity Fe/Cu permease
MEELRKDKLTLREFLAIKEKTIEENAAKIKELEQQAAELKV